MTEVTSLQVQFTQIWIEFMCLLLEDKNYMDTFIIAMHNAHQINNHIHRKSWMIEKKLNLSFKFFAGGFVM